MLSGKTELTRLMRGDRANSGGEAYAGAIKFCKSGKLIKDSPIYGLLLCPNSNTATRLPVTPDLIWHPAE